jgi:RNA polymerase sigma factor (sigma-70 family)
MTFERLGEVRGAYRERKQLAEKIVELETMRISPRGAVYGSERVQTSMKGDIQPDSIAAIESLLKVYNAKLQKCCALIEEFEEALERLRDRERIIMRCYYIDGMTWGQICKRENISWTTKERIRKNSIRKLLQNPKN